MLLLYMMPTPRIIEHGDLQRAWGEAGMAANLDAANRKRVNEGPMPYFTNREGLKGLEAGLKCNLPTFSVFKYNVDAILAQQEQKPVVAIQQFMQNWIQKIAAPTSANRATSGRGGRLDPGASLLKPFSARTVFSSPRLPCLNTSRKKNWIAAYR